MSFIDGLTILLGEECTNDANMFGVILNSKHSIIFYEIELCRLNVLNQFNYRAIRLTIIEHKKEHKLHMLINQGLFMRIMYMLKDTFDTF